MTHETFLGVVYGLAAWFGISFLLIFLWATAKRAHRNRLRRAAAEQRAANVAKRIGMRWCPCCTRRSLRGAEVICPWCETEMVLAFDKEQQS